MDHPISRRAFASLAAGTVAAAALGAQNPAGPVEAPLDRDYPEPSFKPSWRRPQINRDMVYDFVIYAHSDLEMVKRLLDKEPGLLNATADWGGGDWETALGGASHIGRRDIAAHLLQRGARLDLFCAAMMGNLEVVKAAIAMEPGLRQAKGPHGIPLLAHAKAGGAPAKAVVEFLERD